MKLRVLFVLNGLVMSWMTFAEPHGVRADDTQASWSQFRGADATGVASSTGLPDQWSATENVEWKQEIAGRGWSSPVVWGNRVFLSTVVSSVPTEPVKKGLYFGGDRPDVPQATHQWKVLCLDLVTGTPLWDRTVREGIPTGPIHLKNSYASETPVTDGKHLYVCFGNVGIFCFDLEGNAIWKHDLQAHPTRFGWGTASSPVLHGDRLFYVCDNDEKSTMIALNKQTGELIWSIDRDEKSNWATPFVWVNPTRIEVVTAGTKAVRAYDLDGNLLWTLQGMSSITIATPYVVDGILYVSSGYVLDKVKPIYAIRPGATGDITLSPGSTSNQFIVWSDDKIAPYNPSTLVHATRLFVLYDRGTVSCFKSKTGEALYANQKLKRGTAFTASPWCYNNKIFCLDEDGFCTVLKEGDTLEISHTNALLEDDLCMATPAIAGDRLLIRSDLRLYCIRNKK